MLRFTLSMTVSSFKTWTGWYISNVLFQEEVAAEERTLFNTRDERAYTLTRTLNEANIYQQMIFQFYLVIILVYYFIYRVSSEVFGSGHSVLYL